MADFCHECSINHFSQDYGDLRGLSKAEDTEAGLFANAICEGCGFIQVDHLGHCLGGPACMEKHVYPHDCKCKTEDDTKFDLGPIPIDEIDL